MPHSIPQITRHINRAGQTAWFIDGVSVRFWNMKPPRHAAEAIEKSYAVFLDQRQNAPADSNMLCMSDDDCGTATLIAETADGNRFIAFGLCDSILRLFKKLDQEFGGSAATNYEHVEE